MPSESHLISNRLTPQQTRRAKKNWHFWFDSLHGLSYLGGRNLSFLAIHNMLRTGRFDVWEEAGQCVNKEMARTYVSNQLMELNNVGAFGGHV